MRSRNFAGQKRLTTLKAQLDKTILDQDAALARYFLISESQMQYEVNDSLAKGLKSELNAAIKIAAEDLDNRVTLERKASRR